VHNARLDHPIMSRLNSSALSFDRVEGNSAEISRYLLETYNDQNRDLRIGGLAMPDTVTLNVTAALSSFEGLAASNATDAGGALAGVPPGAVAVVGAAAARSLLRCDALLDSTIGRLPYSLNLTQPVIDGLRNATDTASLLLEALNATLSGQLSSGGADAPPIDASRLFNNSAACAPNGPASQLANFVALPPFFQQVALAAFVASLGSFQDQLPDQLLEGTAANLAALLQTGTFQQDLLAALPSISEAVNCLCADAGTSAVPCVISSDVGAGGIAAAIELLPALQILLLVLEESSEQPIPLRALAQAGLEMAASFEPAANSTNVAALEAAFDMGCAALAGYQTNASEPSTSWQAIYDASGAALPPPPPADQPLTINGESPSAFALELAQTVLPVVLARVSAAAFPLSLSLPPLLASLPEMQRAMLEMLGVPMLLQSLANGTELTLDQLASADFYLRDFVSPDPVVVVLVDEEEQLRMAVSGMGVRLGTLFLSDDQIMVDGFRLIAEGALLEPSGEQRGPDIPLSVGVEILTFNATGFSAVNISFAADPIASKTLPDVRARPTDDIPLDRITGVAQLPVSMTILFNASSPHANAAMLGEVSAAAWRAVHELAPGASPDDDEPLVYAFYNHPLPLTAAQSAQIQVVLAFLAGIFVLVPFCYIPAAVAALIVKERVSKAKHLQLVSGTNPYVYWLAHFVWDIMQYTFVAVATLIVFVAYGEPAFVGSAAQGLASFLVVWLYGFAAIPLSYCYTWLFDSHATAQIGIIIFNLVTGFVMVLAHQIMQVIPDTRDADAVLVHIYRFFPPFNFGQAILSLTQDWYIAELLDTPRDPFASPDVVRAFYILPLECLFFFAILMAIEHSYATHALLLRLTRVICGGETLGCAFRAKLACGITSAVALLLVIIGAAGLSGGSDDDVQSALTVNDGASAAPPPPPPADDSAAGDAIILVVGVLLLAAAIASCILYERRLRRRGGTMEETAFRALQETEGPGFEEESDVRAERQTVDALVGSTASGRSAASGNAVVVHRLNKVFAARGKARPKVAVVDLSLRINDGECFGFLGVNGAGKTTSISMLTGEYPPTKGSAWIGGHNVATKLKQVREQLGYCPQFDPLLDLMTARELLTMFAQLKNLPAHEVKPTVESLIDRVTLTPYADRVCGSYSGGNKRKLSLAIALIGSPRVIFLDEPSSGMDPASRRHMWDVITSERDRCAVVLTTHSMEECEALCTRLGIMAGGRFRCLGGQQHLKSKYGHGYTLDLRVEPAKHDDAAAGVRRLFPSASMLEEHASKFKFELPAASVKLHEIFDRMEQAKDELGVLDYSASQPTLESLFLSVVGPEGAVRGGQTAPAQGEGTPPKSPK
jgi:ABC-type multidrug transport system ATPase subunit